MAATRPCGSISGSMPGVVASAVIALHLAWWIISSSSVPGMAAATRGVKMAACPNMLCALSTRLPACPTFWLLWGVVPMVSGCVELSCGDLVAVSWQRQVGRGELVAVSWPWRAGGGELS